MAIGDLEENITTLEDIWGGLKPGDVVLYQILDPQKRYSKPMLVIIVGVDIFDMAVGVWFVDYKSYRFSQDNPKVECFGEWSYCWNVLGHWNTMPKFKELLNAYRLKK